MKKILAKIHLWLSLPLGIVITVICLSGATLVFESEITRALYPDIYRSEPAVGAQRLTPSQLVARIDYQVPDSLHLTSLQLPAQRDEPCMASFRETGRTQLSVDPYTGAVNGWTESPAFFRTMRKLHRWLLDAPATRGSGSAGKLIVGISTLLMVVITLTGLILWIPRSRKALRNRLRISLTNGRRRFWHDCHVSLGFYATLLLLVMALTGLTWSFGWYRTAAYSLFGGTEQTARTHANDRMANGSATHKERGGERHDHSVKRHLESAEQVATEKSQFDYAVWDEVLTQLTAQYPAYRSVVLTQTEAQVERQSAMRRTDRATFDPHSGRLDKIVRYEDTPRQQRLRGWFYSVHTGSWGGILTKILYFIAALIGATLPLTGYYLWWKRIRQRQKPNKADRCSHRTDDAYE